MCTLNQIKSLVLQSHEPHFKLTGHIQLVATLLRQHSCARELTGASSAP